jgi:hypothetical protein
MPQVRQKNSMASVLLGMKNLRKSRFFHERI